jgi:hypothetical protein
VALGGWRNKVRNFFRNSSRSPHTIESLARIPNISRHRADKSKSVFIGAMHMKFTSFSDSSQIPDDSNLRPKSEVDGSKPSDSSLANQRWESEAGPRRPLESPDLDLQTFSSPAEKESDSIALITLPFSEYSAVFPDRMANLQFRLNSTSKNPSKRFLIVDLTRIMYPSKLLIDMLRDAAIMTIRDGKNLVLIGTLNGLVARAGLAELCHTVENLKAAQEFCREALEE